MASRQDTTITFGGVQAYRFPVCSGSCSNNSAFDPINIAPASLSGAMWDEISKTLTKKAVSYYGSINDVPDREIPNKADMGAAYFKKHSLQIFDPYKTGDSWIIAESATVHTEKLPPGFDK